MSEFEAMIQQRNELTEKIKRVGKEEFGALIAGIFATTPGLENFGWWNAHESRYNDGAYPGLSGLAVNIEILEDNNYVDLDRDYYSRWDEEKGIPKSEIVKLQDKIDEFMKPFESLVLELFDEDQVIVVFADRVETFWHQGY